MTKKELAPYLRPKAKNAKDAARNIDASPEMLTAMFGKDDTTNRLLAHRQQPY